MGPVISRRGMLQAMAVAPAICRSWRLRPTRGFARPGPPPAIVGSSANTPGAHITAAALQQHGVGCVFGIPGAQENELWDAFKIARPAVPARHARVLRRDAWPTATPARTGKPGVLCVVPGPGVTNSLTGLGEALLDCCRSSAIVGDVGQRHEGRAVPGPLRSIRSPCCSRSPRASSRSQTVGEIPGASGRRSRLAAAGEPGPAAVVMPYNLFIEAARLPRARRRRLPAAVRRGGFRPGACDLLARPQARASASTPAWAAWTTPPRWSSSPSCCKPRSRPASPARASSRRATRSRSAGATGRRRRGRPRRRSEHVDLRAGHRREVSARSRPASTRIPQPKHLIHVDANPNNLGRVLKPDVCVHADAGLFLDAVLGQCRPPAPRRANPRWSGRIHR